MLVLNPNKTPVVAMYDRGSYVFKAGERKEINNFYAARSILERWKKHGLIDITFNEKVAKQFPEHELYVHHQTIEGLRNKLEYLLNSAQHFQSYDDECGEKKSAIRHNIQRQGRDLQARIKEVEDHIKEVEAQDTQELLVAKSKLLMEQAAKLMEQADSLDGRVARKPKNVSKD